ncbi:MULTISPECIES: ABC-ATPase domain-containing protein [Kocuria]|uniref:ABC-ATPase domain-containing protein n=1 Tax=Kocuria TaxID=57493 RepID=UPI0021A94627|nr:MULTISPECIES: ABC-ATPase domain-containing protein [Kocuria]MCT1544472.1 ABC-ATPase domain-containing protein [Kocuria rhizophila]MCT2170535.1 ABC-ATPase domain-containing protein [Kocuria rhizophila]MDN3463486.1 ABC-ATPase domain-containing protein [Kocuria sp. APC 4018]
MSSPRTDLAQTLRSLDGGSYGAYKQLKGSWQLGDAELIVDRVQSDPYAPPSLARIRVSLADTGIPPELIATRDARVAAGDFLTREFARAARDLGPRGGKDSGGISIQRTGQEILERSSVIVPDPGSTVDPAPARESGMPRTGDAVTESGGRGAGRAASSQTADPGAAVELRCEIALPAAGRRIRGHAAHRLLTEVLPGVVERALRWENLDPAAFEAHVTSHLDAQHLRAQLPQRGLVAFVADGAVLPRASGHRDEPLAHGAVPFETPPRLRVELELEDGSTVSGMGVPEGVTVVVGGGYHGKSTLLQALERGVYSHVPGDGRERVVTLPSAVSVRAEDGRAVSHTDVSPFITNLPTGADTRDFSTSNASGSTSQAAATVEAVEAEAGVLLLDEDTCATNLMVRDERMRAMVPGEREPITPFVDRVGALYTERGVSSILVTGGSGAFLDVADLVIAMHDYRALDVTDRARQVVRHFLRPDDMRPAESFGQIRSHVPGGVSGASDTLPAERGATPPGSGAAGHDAARPGPRHGTAHRGGRDKPARARGLDTIQRGREDVDVSALSQLVDPSQTEAIARLIEEVERTADGRTPLTELVDAALERVVRDGLDALAHHRGHPGHLALPRAQDVAAAYHRIRR